MTQGFVAKKTLLVALEVVLDVRQLHIGNC